MNKTTGPEQSLKIYEIICMIKEKGLDLTISYLKNDKLLWSNPIFEKEKVKIEEENNFIVCPYELSEGVLVCRKCNCRKIYSFSKQTRSMDEPTTVFALCSVCGYKWCEGS